MPASKSEASQQLELYKMVTERQRIQQELHFVEQRIQLLKQRLSVLDNKITNAEETIRVVRQSTSSDIQKTPPPKPPQVVPDSSDYQTFYLEY